MGLFDSFPLLHALPPALQGLDPTPGAAHGAFWTVVRRGSPSSLCTWEPRLEGAPPRWAEAGNRRASAPSDLPPVLLQQATAPSVSSGPSDSVCRAVMVPVTLGSAGVSGWAPLVWLWSRGHEDLETRPSQSSGLVWLCPIWQEKDRIQMRILDSKTGGARSAGAVLQDVPGSRRAVGSASGSRTTASC